MRQVRVTDLQVGDLVSVAGHTLRLTERSEHPSHPSGRLVVNFSTVVVSSDPGADPWVTRWAPCDCGRECGGWHVQGNDLATATVVAGQE